MKNYILSRMSNLVLVNCASMIVNDGKETVLPEVQNNARFQNLVLRLTTMNDALQTENDNEICRMRDAEMLKRNSLVAKVMNGLKGKLGSFDDAEKAIAEPLYNRMKPFLFNYSKQKRPEQIINLANALKVLRLPDYADAIVVLKMENILSGLEASAQIVEKYYRDARTSRLEYREAAATAPIREALQADMLEYELWVGSMVVSTEKQPDWVALQKNLNDRFDSSVLSIPHPKSSKTESNSATNTSGAK